MARPTAVLIALLLLPLAFAPTAEAAGTTRGTATPVTDGTIAATAPDEAHHWYVITVPTGKALHVLFQTSSGYAYDEMDLVDADGGSITYVYPGSSVAYDPDDDLVYLHVHPNNGDQAYALTLSFVNVPPQNDAGSGKDAGGRSAFALPVSPGAITGRVDRAAGDHGDWYRLDVPAGLILDVHSAVGTDVHIYVAEGRIGEIHDDPFWDDDPIAFETLTDGRPIFLATYSTYGDAYSFRADVTSPTDLVVGELVVEERTIEMSQGPAPASVARDVLVTIANAADGPSRDAVLTVSVEHAGPTGRRVLAVEPVSLAPGESATLRIAWDTLGQAGEFTVAARLSNEHDIDMRNNEALASAFVHVRGVPYGFDALNHDVVTPSTSAGTEYGGERIGVRTSAGFVGWTGQGVGVA